MPPLGSEEICDCRFVSLKGYSFDPKFQFKIVKVAYNWKLLLIYPLRLFSFFSIFAPANISEFSERFIHLAPPPNVRMLQGFYVGFFPLTANEGSATGVQEACYFTPLRHHTIILLWNCLHKQQSSKIPLKVHGQKVWLFNISGTPFFCQKSQKDSWSAFVPQEREGELPFTVLNFKVFVIHNSN